MVMSLLTWNCLNSTHRSPAVPHKRAVVREGTPRHIAVYPLKAKKDQRRNLTSKQSEKLDSSQEQHEEWLQFSTEAAEVKKK